MSASPRVSAYQAFSFSLVSLFWNMLGCGWLRQGSGLKVGVPEWVIICGVSTSGSIARHFVSWLFQVCGISMGSWGLENIDMNWTYLHCALKLLRSIAVPYNLG